MKRRDFLLFLGVGTGTILFNQSQPIRKISLISSSAVAQSPNSLDKLSFNPLKIAIPLNVENLSDEQQKTEYKTYELVDDVILPEGFTYDVIGMWGDPIGESRFGYNNDYLSLIETSPNQGLLTINFEYISGKTWMDTYEKVIGESLPFTEVRAKIKDKNGTINAFALSENEPLKEQIKLISQEGLIDQGMGVISIAKNSQGKWERTYSNVDRRITGISGLEDDNYLKATGPGVAVFEKAKKLGYEDNLGNKIIGTFQNCAGGTTPWRTVLSAEENIQYQVPEPVMADGSSLDPSQTPFVINNKLVDGRGNVFGLAGNKYGWMVEIDPTNPSDYGTKHTWLGRYRHEAVAFRAFKGQKLAVYSGCDRRGGHLYKFVSTEIITNINDKKNSRLMEQGMLYGAVFKPDGTGQWIPLNPDTKINPVFPSQVQGNLVTLPNPNRTEGGMIKVTEDKDIIAFKKQFKTLNDLYLGNSQEKQGAILIDAHFAANAAGITCTARPEDTEVTPDGTLYVTFTSGSPGGDGGPDTEIFRGPNGETDYEFGWILRLQEDNNDSSSMTFRWELFVAGGEPAEGGLGFSNPDNLEFDNNGNLWMVTDMSTSSQNREISSRTKDGQPISTKDRVGLFGNNAVWYLPLSGVSQGNAYPFAIGPMEVEMTGPWFTQDQKTLFFSVQHPGEKNGTRVDLASEVRQFALLTTSGQEFIQERTVPLGSNWPSKQPNDPPRPAVIAIRRIDHGTIPNG